jgi:2-octaprenyl-6-methoxyphenol hydroxylase
MERYEVIIVGGGMAGLTQLAAIHPAIQQGLSVAIIDPGEQVTSSNNHSPSFDDRATALSAHALETLTSFGVKALDNALSSITSIEVSDRSHAGYHRMAASEQRLERFGAVISNRVFGSLLWDHTCEYPIQWRFKTGVSEINPRQNGHVLTLSTGEQLEAGLVLLCDGGRSTLTESLGMTHQSRPFHAHARVASVKTTQPHDGAAFERFTEQGPVALLPFGQQSTLVWTIPDRLRSSLPETKLEALPWLNKHFGQRLGKITEISDWVEYPLTERLLNPIAAHGLLALGNTAATLHPVAGQGFNLAIRGIVRIANLINKQYAEDNKVPDFKQLNDVAKDIRNDQENTALFSRELINAYGSSNPLIQLGRGIGLNSLDRHPLFSHAFALGTMGHLAKTPTSTQPV